MIIFVWCSIFSCWDRFDDFRLMFEDSNLLIEWFCLISSFKILICVGCVRVLKNFVLSLYSGLDFIVFFESFSVILVDELKNLLDSVDVCGLFVVNWLWCM